MELCSCGHTYYSHRGVSYLDCNAVGCCCPLYNPNQEVISLTKTVNELKLKVQSLEEQLAIFKSRYCEWHLQEIHADHIVLAHSGCALCNIQGWKIKYEQLEDKKEEREAYLQKAFDVENAIANYRVVLRKHAIVKLEDRTYCKECKHSWGVFGEVHAKGCLASLPNQTCPKCNCYAIEHSITGECPILNGAEKATE